MDDYSNILIVKFDLTLISARQKGGGYSSSYMYVKSKCFLHQKRDNVGTHVLTIDI